jgi:gamma-glutamylcyclotransferase (GGCT)/AIG2-like uncharacterized protein YtfP
MKLNPSNGDFLCRVFVYGTLLKGESNHQLLRSAQFVSEGTTKPTFELRNLGAFPAMVLGGTSAVTGEVYDVDVCTLAALDKLEGHPTFYVRTPIKLADGTAVETYLLRTSQVKNFTLITSGSWRTNQKELRA